MLLQNVRVKVCCMRSEAEVRMAIDAGAAALGFVSPMPSGPGTITDDDILRIVRHVPPPISTFLLTCHQSIEPIIKQQRHCRCNTLQLCDDLVEGTHEELRAALPGVSIVQVIHVCGEHSFDQAMKVAPHVNALLLDSGNQSLAVKELGGTGRTHDWDISRRICAESPVPVFLAGGLNPDNVRQAVEKTRPFGVDLCSGVRTNDHLDEIKLRRFFEALRA